MQKLAEIFREASLHFGIENFYVGDVQSSMLEKYIFDKKHYQYVGGIDKFPFVALNVLQKKRWADKRTEQYAASICYGNLIPSNRINQIFEKETAEALLIEIFEKAVEISKQPKNLLNITLLQDEYSFSYEEYIGNASYYFVFLELNILTR